MIAVFPDDILNIRELDTTLVGFGHDRASGDMTRRVLIEGAPQRPLRVFGSSTGALYAQLDECTYGVCVERDAIDTFDLVDQAELPCDVSRVKVLIHVVPAGLEVGRQLVLESPIDADPAPTVELGRVPVAADDVPSDVAPLAVTRHESSGSDRSWLGWIEGRADSSPGFGLTHLAPFGDGAAAGLLNQGVVPVLATLGTGDASHSYALGNWTIAGIDERDAVFWRQTPDDRGIEVARLPT